MGSLIAIWMSDGNIKFFNDRFKKFIITMLDDNDIAKVNKGPGIYSNLYEAKN